MDLENGDHAQSAAAPIEIQPTHSGTPDSSTSNLSRRNQTIETKTRQWAKGEDLRSPSGRCSA